MRTRLVMIAGLAMLALLCAAASAAATPATTTSPAPADIGPAGTFAADSPLYGLGIAMEDLDESFTFNQTAKMEKQLLHARLRLHDAQEQLDANRTGPAGRALGYYQQKMNQTLDELGNLPDNSTGFLHAQEMTRKHGQILAALLESHPGNPGLMRAYNNSQLLDRKLTEKNAIRLQHHAGQVNETGTGNVTGPAAIREENRDKGNAGNGNAPGIGNQTRQQIHDNERAMVHVTDNQTAGPGNAQGGQGRDQAPGQNAGKENSGSTGNNAGGSGAGTNGNAGGNAGGGQGNGKGK